MGDRDTLTPDDFSQAAADRRRGAEPVIPVMTRGELADAKQAAFAEGTRVGRAQAEAEELATYYAGDTLNAAPTTYDAAVVALEVAGRCVHRIDVAGYGTPEAQRLLVGQHAHGITALADELVRWLSEHVEPDVEPGAGGGRPISELVIDEVVRWPVEQQATADRCSACGMSMSGAGGCSDPWCPGAKPDAPLPPEQQPCPNCLAGKHDNCPGRIPGAGLTYLPCPCAGQTHPESLGS